MTIKESLLNYFRNINYAYNDISMYDTLKIGLSELEEVVRCQDCVHFSKGSEEFGLENDCDFHEWYRAEPKEDDYCSRGERKENV